MRAASRAADGSADRDDAADSPLGEWPVADPQRPEPRSPSPERPERGSPHGAGTANAVTATSYEPWSRDQFAVVPVGAESADQSEPVAGNAVCARAQRTAQQLAEPDNDPVPAGFAESGPVDQQSDEPFVQSVGSFDRSVQSIHKIKQSKEFGEPEPIDAIRPFLLEQVVYIHSDPAFDEHAAGGSDAVGERTLARHADYAAEP